MHEINFHQGIKCIHKEKSCLKYKHLGYKIKAHLIKRLPMNLYPCMYTYI